MANETKPKQAEIEVKSKEAVKVPARAVGPFEEMERLMERLSEGFFPRSWLRRMQWEWPQWPQLAELPALRMPHVDVVDRDTDVLVRAEVPGVDKKDLEISVSEGTITIKGSTKREQKQEEGEYYRREISESSYARTVALPTEVDGTQAKAKCNDGVVEVTIPKVATSRRHNIKVD
jgi:HSP20 family protein